jgi:hypothetical protein
MVSGVDGAIVARHVAEVNEYVHDPVQIRLPSLEDQTAKL